MSAPAPGKSEIKLRRRSRDGKRAAHALSEPPHEGSGAMRPDRPAARPGCRPAAAKGDVAARRSPRPDAALQRDNGDGGLLDDRRRGDRGFLAAPFGWVDWFAIPARTRAKSVGLMHGLGNVVVLLAFLGSWLTVWGSVWTTVRTWTRPIHYRGAPQESAIPGGEDGRLTGRRDARQAWSSAGWRARKTGRTGGPPDGRRGYGRIEVSRLHVCVTGGR